jgi:hemoglobin/transferrin/lactoferrin receptor protein
MMASSIQSWEQYLSNAQPSITVWSFGFCCMLALWTLNLHAEVNALHDSENEIDVSMPATKLDMKADAEEVDTLPEVTVTDTRVKAPETGINRTLPITTITSEQLQRAQPSNIFDAVRSVPGVSITGGPRPSGMTFNIRGYGDNEDVMVKVDGVPKGFEKYRMGGTFIEPELLKSIEVQRGPQITSGSGSLGGTVNATTKNAEDFLKPGQKYGGKAKFGYGNNSDEYSRSYLLYARPDERVDILYNYSNRQSNNMTLGDGTKLDNSAIESISHLLKVSVFPTEDLQLVTSVVKFDDTGLQPYDATGGQPGFFGNVIRKVDDLTWSETVHYDPESQWVNLKVTLGAGHTNLHDLAKPGMSSVINPIVTGCSGTTYTPDPSQVSRCPGNATDTYQYKTKMVDISNQAIFFERTNLNLSLLAGYQYNASDREISRTFDNPLSVAQSRYPEGFNASAPPGSKSFNAIYIQPKIEVGQFTVTPGYRQDRYQVEAAGGTLALLQPYDQKSKIRFKEETWSLGLAYDAFAKNNPDKLTFYSNYGQGFRPPLIDEYFTQGPFSRCRALLMPISGPDSLICGDLYQPQRSETTEVGVSYQTPHLLNTDVWFSGKLNFYHTYTSHLLLSLREEADGTITQDGWERRNGVEVESFLQYRGWYMRSGYSRINGEIFNGLAFAPLFTAPGNALNINVGAELTKQLEVNVTYRKVSERDILISGDGTVNSRYVFGQQDGYEMWNAGIRLKVNEQLTFRLIGENLKNEEYRLDGSMGGLGMYGPGRNVKFLVEMTY